MQEEEIKDEIQEEDVQDDSQQDDAQATQDESQTAEEEVQEEEQAEETVDEAEHEEQVDEPQEEAPSRRESLRIQQLLKKYGPPEERAAPNNEGVNYRDMIDAPDDVYDQLSKASTDYGQSRYNDGLKEASKVRFETRLEIDTPRVEAKYPQLDKSSEDFNPAVSDSLNNMYLSAVGYNYKTGYVQNPNLRYGEYIEAIMELADEAASRKVETSKRNITRQASRTGIRPDGSSAKRLDLNKDPSQMSDDELDAVLARNGLAPKR